MNSANASPLDFSKAVMNPEHQGRKECNLEPALSQQAHLAFTHNFFFLYGGWGGLYTPRPPFIIIQPPQRPFFPPESIFTREQGVD